MKKVINLADEITLDSSRKNIIKNIANSTEFYEAFELRSVTTSNVYIKFLSIKSDLNDKITVKCLTCSTSTFFHHLKVYYYYWLLGLG